MTGFPYSIEALGNESLPSFCKCLEDWSEEMEEAGDLKCRWVEEMKDCGLGVFMARNPEGRYVGMIQYIPSEYSSVDGDNIYHIHCCWVHAYKGKGVGDMRKRGIGKALLAAAEMDIRSRGASGVSAWGLSIPVWMKASWYRKHGYRKVDRNGVASLMWKPFSEDVPPPRWRLSSHQLKNKAEGDRLSVLSVVNGICPAMNIGHERIRKLAESYGNRLNYRRIAVRTPEDIAEWGITDGLFINGKAVPLGPPPAEKKLRMILERELKHMSL